MIKTRLLVAASAASLALCSQAFAEDHSHHHHHHHHSEHKHIITPDSLMGTHMHDAGEWMFSYRFKHMRMDGNQKDGSSISDDEIATTIPNRFSGMAGQPPTLRIVPQVMSMDMHMFGAMYGVNDWLTLMGMAMYMKKDMTLTTYMGGMGTTTLGNFSTYSSGLGDTKVSSLIKLYENNSAKIHGQLGFSLPTGSIDEEDDVLTPMNMRTTMRLPYSMQLGTGTYDFLPALTYAAAHDSWSWGAQYQGEIRLEDENDEGYAWGDKHTFNSWVGYQWADWIGSTARLSAWTMDEIDGIDSNIMGPVQTADPDNYGGETVEFGLGINLSPPDEFSNHSMSLELATPLYQDLNGVQMETDWSMTFAWKATF